MIETITVGIEEKKNVVRALAERCPQGHNVLISSCPLRNVRKLTTENYTHYISRLTEGQVDRILDYHKACYGFQLKP